MLPVSFLFFVAGCLALALGISGTAGLVPFELGREAFFTGLCLAIATFLGALLSP